MVVSVHAKFGVAGGVVVGGVVVVGDGVGVVVVGVGVVWVGVGVVLVGVGDVGVGVVVVGVGAPSDPMGEVDVVGSDTGNVSAEMVVKPRCRVTGLDTWSTDIHPCVGPVRGPEPHRAGSVQPVKQNATAARD